MCRLLASSAPETPGGFPSLASWTIRHPPLLHCAPRCPLWQIALTSIYINLNCPNIIYKKFKGIKYLINIHFIVRAKSFPLNPSP